MDWTYILTTALGSGGLASLITWLLNRELYRAKAMRDREGVWKEMYEGNNDALLKQNDEIRRLYDALGRLERLLFMVNSCRYYDTCPAKSGLQSYKANLRSADSGQPPLQRKTHRNARDHPDVEGSIDDPDGRPP